MAYTVSGTDAPTEAIEEALEMALQAGTVEDMDAQILRAITQLVHLRGLLLERLS